MPLPTLPADVANGNNALRSSFTGSTGSRTLGGSDRGSVQDKTVPSNYDDLHESDDDEDDSLEDGLGIIHKGIQSGLQIINEDDLNKRSKMKTT